MKILLVDCRLQIIYIGWNSSLVLKINH